MGIRTLNWFEVRNSVQFYQKDKSPRFSWWESASVWFCWELGILAGRRVCLGNSREINNSLRTSTLWRTIGKFESGSNKLGWEWLGNVLLLYFAFEIKCSSNVNQLDFSKSKSFFFLKRFLGMFDLQLRVVGEAGRFSPLSYIRCSCPHSLPSFSPPRCCAPNVWISVALRSVWQWVPSSLTLNSWLDMWIQGLSWGLGTIHPQFTTLSGQQAQALWSKDLEQAWEERRAYQEDPSPSPRP